jgi:hypothetical protein
MLPWYPQDLQSRSVIDSTLGFPVHRLSSNRLNASLEKFALVARENGLSQDEIADAVRTLRAALALTETLAQTDYTQPATRPGVR